MVMHCKVLSISDANKASNKSGVAKTEPVLVSKDAVPEGVPAGIIDIDKESENDPYQCPEYAPDIFSYLAKIEVCALISSVLSLTMRIIFLFELQGFL